MTRFDQISGKAFAGSLTIHEWCSVGVPSLAVGPWIVAIASCLCFTGCRQSDGPERQAVSGTVSLDSKPLSAGVIRFIPTGNTKGPAAMATIHNGTFALEDENGPLVGSHRVEIEATEHFGFAIDDEAAYAEQIEKRQRGRVPANPVPRDFNRDSTLTAEIGPDQPQELQFTLTTKRQPVARR